MINKIKPSKLGVILLIYVVISAAVAFILNIPFYSAVESIVKDVSEGKVYFKREVNQLMDNFQTYVNNNGIRADDGDDIAKWNSDNWFVSMKIYKGNKVFYDTLYYPNEVPDKSEENEFYSSPMARNYEIQFSDIKANIVVVALFRFRFQNFIEAISITFMALTFIITFLLLFSRKIKYLRKIEMGIKIVESGSLKYRIPVKGNDELSSLASSINEMSHTLENQLIKEREMKNKNKDIVTSISHDVRTPLTSVICYLDLIKDHKYNSPEQLEQYIKNVRSKAYQIKDLTDDLFTHFVNSGEEVSKGYEKINANEFIFKLLLDSSYTLEEKGFHITIENELYNQYHIYVDVTQFRRIFDNLCSNIIKYARKDKPIVFLIKVEDSKLLIIQKNRVSNFSKNVESFGIGIKNCEKIVAYHNGSINVNSDDKEFAIEISIPAKES
ncbi:HAMP domain-containing sensor histidine kinase [Clostridioides difficile]|uniref:HAMP domain-containing sensor histidine kinase n=1 Tax=Clostridioides difficile TaxID=1496 RepID=UPI00098AFCCF|nr:HAMP domain-containing sensor histidine kinase [Clostridioides difficile]